MRSKIYFINIVIFLLLVGSVNPSMNVLAANNNNVVTYHNPLYPNIPAVSENIIHIPGDASNLQTAISQVTNGGIIELSSGSYPAPSGGFRINNTHKGFTIRAAAGATVALDGRQTTDILRMQNSSVSDGGPIIFEKISFINGRSTTEGVAAGITLYEAEATFIECIFSNNVSNVSTTVGGSVYVAEHSMVFFFSSTFIDNTSRIGGAGIGIRSQSKVFIHASQFVHNIANPPNHDIGASGGAINLGNSYLRVTNTLFQDNETGAFGGAIYAIGNWSLPYTTPQADILVINSAFINNKAYRDPTVTGNFPTEGGAITAEDQVILKIYNSRFTTNSSMIAGGVDSYRASVEIYKSIFQGNQATDTAYQSGFGGSVSINSADGHDDGTNNRPVGTLIVEDSIFQGKYGSANTVAQTGGCIFAGGDGNRIDGNPYVPDMGTVADNRAPVVIRRSGFYDCDVSDQDPYSGVGGAIEVALANLLIEDSIISNSDAQGVFGSGGGAAILYNSVANINNTTFSNNSADKFGGGIFAQGSLVNLSNNVLVENTVNSGTYGAAMFSAQMDDKNLPATGLVENNTECVNDLRQLHSEFTL